MKFRFRLDSEASKCVEWQRLTRKLWAISIGWCWKDQPLWSPAPIYLMTELSCWLVFEARIRYSNGDGAFCPKIVINEDRRRLSGRSTFEWCQQSDPFQCELCCCFVMKFTIKKRPIYGYAFCPLAHPGNGDPANSECAITNYISAHCLPHPLIFGRMQFIVHCFTLTNNVSHFKNIVGSDRVVESALV